MKTFVFYESWLNVIRELPNDIQLDIYRAIAEYGTGGNTGELSPVAKLAFNFIKQDIDRDTEKYMSIRESRKLAGQISGERRRTKRTSVDFVEQNEQKGTKRTNVHLATDNQTVIDNLTKVKNSASTIYSNNIYNNNIIRKQCKFDFEKAWEMYGRKGNKKTSERKWANLKNHCREAALKQIPLYVAATPEKQYRKNFETYLNQEAWNDELPVQKPVAVETETREIANEEYRLNRYRLTPRTLQILLQKAIDEVPAQTTKESFNRVFDRIFKQWKNDELD